MCVPRPQMGQNYLLTPGLIMVMVVVDNNLLIQRAKGSFNTRAFKHKIVFLKLIARVKRWFKKN